MTRLKSKVVERLDILCLILIWVTPTPTTQSVSSLHYLSTTIRFDSLRSFDMIRSKNYVYGIRVKYY